MTDIQVVRLLINDSTAPQTFSDEELQAFLDLNGGSVYLACALAMDTFAVEDGISVGGTTSVKIGSYSESNKGASELHQTAADRFRKLEYETPAFAVAQEAFNDEGALLLIRDYVLRLGI